MARGWGVPLAIVLAAGLIIAGCGGDDEDTTTAATTTVGEPLSKSEFIQEADAICNESQQNIDFTAEQLGPGRPSREELERFTNQTLVPEIQQQIDGVSALTPPEGDEQRITKFLDMAQEALDRVKQDPSLLQGGEDPFKETEQLAEDYGFQACAR